jgi:hypothetical protein
MAENEKGLGSKFLGLFVEKDEQGSLKSAADEIAELARKSGTATGAATASATSTAPQPVAAPPPPGPALKMPTGGSTDFDAVFNEAGMDGAELDRVKKAEELLKGLPESTPQDVKRQIVEASLKAFGFDTATIVTASNNQKRALDTYVRVNEQATAKATQDAEAQIKALHEKIAGLKADVEKRNAALRSLTEAATSRKAQVQKVLEFFEKPLAQKA